MPELKIELMQLLPAEVCASSWCFTICVRVNCKIRFNAPGHAQRKWRQLQLGRSQSEIHFESAAICR